MSWLDYVPGVGIPGVGNWTDLLNEDTYHGLFDKPGNEQVNKFIGQGQPYLDPATMKLLQDRAMGNGPSVAGDAFKNASQLGMAQQLAMSRSAGSAGAGRMAAQNMGNMNQGMANGYATARNQEMQGATGQLLGAQQGNQQAWLELLRQMMGGKSVADNMNGVIQGAAQAGQMAAKM